jgi:hypothetical protein
MEVANAAGNVRRLFQLIRSTGPKALSVSETITEQDGTAICNRNRRLSRWGEYFRGQFSWAPATTTFDIPQSNTWQVTMAAPSKLELQTCISSLKRNKAAGPDELHPILFKEGGEVLLEHLTSLFQLIWEREDIPDNWGESIIIPIFKKGVRNDCANHRGISLTPVITRIFASLLLRRLTPIRESQVREEQAGFRPGRGCIDHIFSLRQLLEQRHSYRKGTIAIFLDFKGAFDSVDRTSLFGVLSSKGIPQKYVNILQALYSHTTGQVRVYGELSDKFETTSGVRQGCPISPFLFNFVIDVIMEECLRESGNLGIQVLPGDRLLDLDYADDIVLLFDSFGQAQVTLDRLSGIIRAFGMSFAPSKCKVMLQDIAPDVNLVLQNQELQVVDKFIYLGSCINNSGTLSDEVDARISKARLTFRGLNHLWRHKGISLRVKGRVYSTTVRAVLLYGCETWTLRSEDLRCLQVFGNRCLRSIAGIGWSQRIRNEVVRNRVLGSTSTLDGHIYLCKLRWLGHVLRMPATRLPRRILFSEPSPEWRKARGGQSMTWQRQMKEVTKSLGSVGSARLCGWGPRDSSNQWLFTLDDMAQNRAQWRSCCKHLIETCVCR